MSKALLRGVAPRPLVCGICAGGRTGEALSRTRCSGPAGSTRTTRVRSRSCSFPLRRPPRPTVAVKTRAAAAPCRSPRSSGTPSPPRRHGLRPRTTPECAAPHQGCVTSRPSLHQNRANHVAPQRLPKEPRLDHLSHAQRSLTGRPDDIVLLLHRADVDGRGDMQHRIDAVHRRTRLVSLVRSASTKVSASPRCMPTPSRTAYATMSRDSTTARSSRPRAPMRNGTISTQHLR